MIIENKTTEALRRHGFSVEEKTEGFEAEVASGGGSGVCSILKGSLSGAMAYAREIENGSEKMDIVHNQNDGRHQLTGGDSVFKGGVWSQLKIDLEGGMDLTMHKKIKEDLGKSEFMKRLRTKVQELSPRRSRLMSEHDGEYSHDRRYDLKPFNTTFRAPTATKVMEMQIGFSVNCGVTKERMDRYGAVVWAVSDLLESIGITTKMTMVMASRAVGPGLNSFMQFEIKKPGEYLAPTMVAAAFQTNFFRRVGFLFYVASCEVEAKQVSGSLGSSQNNTKQSCEFIDGKLLMSPGLVYDSGLDEAGIEEALIKALGGEK